MAEQPIDKNDLIKSGAIDAITKEFDTWLKKLGEIDTALDEIKKSAEIKPPANTEDFAKLTAKIEQLEKALKNKVETQKKVTQIEKESLKLSKQAEKARLSEIRLEKAREKSIDSYNEKLSKASANKKKAAQKEIKRNEKARIDEIKLQQAREKSIDSYNSKLAKQEKDKTRQAQKDAKNAERERVNNEKKLNAYNKLTKKTRDYKNESKRLGAELLALGGKTKKNSKEWNKLSLEYSRVTRNAKLGDAQLKKIDKTVGDNQRNVGNYTSATRKLSSALGALGIAFGISTVVRSVTGVIKDYSTAQADLRAITQKSAEELQGLTDQARKLGGTTQFTATEVTGLQFELAKLGYTTQDIMNSTGGIADFAAATGADIPRAAKLAGSSLRAFGLDASEMDRVVSTLGVATVKTGLDFGQIESAMSSLAPVAAAAGFSIEDTTALLGQLSNSGFEASTAATATRNILLKLADANGDLAKELGKPIKSADDLAGAFKELKDRGIVLSEALELTDVRSVAAFQTFIQGSDDLVALRDSITDAGDELKKLAEDRLISVEGAMKLLSSAWQEFTLSMNESVGASETFTTAVQFIAKNLTTILKSLGKLILAFGVYRLALIAVNIQQNLAGKSLGSLVKGLFSLKKGADGGATSIRKMGAAFKAIVWVALISAAIELATAFYDIASGARDARDAEKELDDYRKGAAENVNEKISNRNKLLQDELTALRQSTEISRSKSKTDAEAAEIEIKFLEDKKRKIEDNNKLIQNDINKRTELKKGYESELEFIDKIRVSNGQIIGGNEKMAESLRKAGFENAKYNDTWKSINVSASDLIDIRSKLNAKIGASEVRLKAFNEELSSSNENLKESETNLIVDSNERENNSSKIKANLDNLKNLNKERQKEILSLKEIDDLLKSGETMDQIEDREIGLFNDSYQKSLTERLTLINNAERLQTITEEEANDQRIIAQIDYLQEKKEILEFYGRKTFEVENEISQAQLQLSKKTNEELIEETESTYKELINSVASSADLLKSLYNDSIDEGIEAQNRLISNSQRTIDMIKGAAMAGTEQAKESILAEEKAIEDAQRRIEKANKRKARIELISSGINTFNQQIASDKSPAQALGATAASMTGLMALLNTLPSFFVGADRLTEKGNGIDNKGGFLAVNHPNERIVTAEQNKMIGFDTANNDIAKVMNYYNKGLLTPATQVTPMVMQNDNSDLIKAFENSFSKMSNYNMNVEELFGQISVIIEKKQNGDIHKFIKKYKA